MGMETQQDTTFHFIDFFRLIESALILVQTPRTNSHIEIYINSKNKAQLRLSHRRRMRQTGYTVMAMVYSTLQTTRLDDYHRQITSNSQLMINIGHI